VIAASKSFRSISNCFSIFNSLLSLMTPLLASSIHLAMLCCRGLLFAYQLAFRIYSWFEAVEQLEYSTLLHLRFHSSFLNSSHQNFLRVWESVMIYHFDKLLGPNGLSWVAIEKCRLFLSNCLSSITSISFAIS